MTVRRPARKGARRDRPAITDEGGAAAELRPKAEILSSTTRDHTLGGAWVWWTLGAEQRPVRYSAASRWRTATAPRFFFDRAGVISARTDLASSSFRYDPV
jgi:hypothetical protein